MALMINKWKCEWINTQHRWNDGDSDIQLESHCTVSSFLVKLLNDEWRGIHHGYCQNVLQHNRNMSLWLSNMSAAAHSSKKPAPSNSKSQPCHFMWHPLLCFQMSCPPVILITGHTLTATITDVLSTCHINHRTHTYCHHNRYNILCTAFMTNLLF
jgi:hypothetical protein